MAVVAVLVIATPAFAITAPDSLTFVRYGVFYNVMETGDMFFTAEARVIYAVEPTDYTASEAFLFELVDTDGSTTLSSVPITDYGDRPIGIYLTAAQVTALGLVVGDGYYLRVTGNPLITFAPATVTPALTVLVNTDYEDVELSVGDELPTDNPLRNLLIAMATAMEDYDAPALPYIVVVDGYKYITPTGAALFTVAFPGLNYACPVLFQTSIEPMSGDAPESTGAYAESLTIFNKWGSSVHNGVTSLADFLGVGVPLTGSLIMSVLGMALAIYIYQKTESGVVVLLAVVALPFIGAFMGLVNLALAFVIAIIISALLGYYFLSRGAL
ncbi:MAG: hypothetical protein WC554_10175 [Clostridia bacterium]